MAEPCLWHDVPLVADSGLFNLSARSRSVLEKNWCTTRYGHQQDEKKGVLREFKKGDIFFNYGCFPRTWEDPRHVSDTGYPATTTRSCVRDRLRQVQTGGSDRSKSWVSWR